jgi:hypothetical protein
MVQLSIEACEPFNKLAGHMLSPFDINKCTKQTFLTCKNKIQKDESIVGDFITLVPSFYKLDLHMHI